MSSDAAKVLNDALRLDEKERAELAARLIDSLDQSADDGADAAWESEIAGRLADLDSGKTKTVPWPQARRMINGNQGRANGASED
jgi:putative addiction module component (TIGR02574 family)